MAKASDNVFPKIIESMNTTDPAAPSDSSWKIYAKAPGIYARSSNAIVGPFGAASSTAGSILALKSSTAGDASTSSTSFVDADASNLVVTFTAPTSTNVIVVCSAVMSPDSGGTNNGALAAWGLREGSTDLTPASMYAARSVIVSATANFLFVSMRFYLAGISAGSHTYKWSHKVSAGTTVIKAIAASPALMEVIAAP